MLVSKTKTQETNHYQLEIFSHYWKGCRIQPPRSRVGGGMNSWFKTRLVIDFLNWWSRFLRGWSLLFGTVLFPKGRVSYFYAISQAEVSISQFFSPGPSCLIRLVRVLLKHETRKHRNKDKITANMNWKNVSLSNRNELEPKQSQFFWHKHCEFSFSFNFNLFFICCRCLPINACHWRHRRE